MPVKRVRRPEENNLRRVPRGREVHWRGIDRNEEPRFANERREGEQGRFPGEIDYACFGGRFDSCNLVLLEGRTTAGQNALHTDLTSAMIDHLRPAARRPELFGARRSGVNTDETVGNSGVEQ